MNKALSCIPKDFAGAMLEVPVGTGVLSMPVYKILPKAKITCLDYSAEMMNNAKIRAAEMNIHNVDFIQGDVGQMTFADGSFDIVLSMNGFHAFPDKKQAFGEVYRVLKPGGIFCGCFYIKGENRRTDWFADHVYAPMGFFTPPFETYNSLKNRLESMYEKVNITAVKAMACFCCVKGEG